MIAKHFLVVATLLLSACAASRGIADCIPCPARGKGRDRRRTNPDLSTAGQERAESLARMLKDAEITAIFTTEFKRTRELPHPPQKRRRFLPPWFQRTAFTAMAEKLRPVKGNALVVAHGNTIADLVKALESNTSPFRRTITANCSLSSWLKSRSPCDCIIRTSFCRDVCASGNDDPQRCQAGELALTCLEPGLSRAGSAALSTELRATS